MTEQHLQVSLEEYEIVIEEYKETAAKEFRLVAQLPTFLVTSSDREHLHSHGGPVGLIEWLNDQ